MQRSLEDLWKEVCGVVIQREMREERRAEADPHSCRPRKAFQIHGSLPTFSSHLGIERRAPALEGGFRNKTWPQLRDKLLPKGVR